MQCEKGIHCDLFKSFLICTYEISSASHENVKCMTMAVWQSSHKYSVKCHVDREVSRDKDTERFIPSQLNDLTVVTGNVPVQSYVKLAYQHVAKKKLQVS